MSAPFPRRRISIGHGVPPTLSSGEENDWHKKIRDILDIAAPPKPTGSVGPRGTKGEHGNSGPSTKKATRRRTVCCQAPIANLLKPREMLTEKADRNHEESTASLSNFGASVSSLDMTPPSPCERPSLGDLMNSSPQLMNYSSARRAPFVPASESSSPQLMRAKAFLAEDGINSPRRTSCPDAARRASYNDMMNFASMFINAGEKSCDMDLEDEGYVPPKAIRVDHSNFDRSINKCKPSELYSMSCHNIGREYKPCLNSSRAHQEPIFPKPMPEEDYPDLSYMSYASKKEEGGTPQSVKVDFQPKSCGSNVAKKSFQDVAAYLKSLEQERATKTTCVYEPKRGKKQEESPKNIPRPHRRMSCSDAPASSQRPSPKKENVLQVPSPKVARRISIQVRRRSSLDYDADKYDVPKPPFPSDERRDSPRRSEVPFHVPEKSLEVQARRDGKSSSTFLLREESRSLLLQKRDDKAKHGAPDYDAKRRDAKVMHRRASDCGPRDYYAASNRIQSTRVFHPRMAIDDVSIGSDECCDRPPISIVICKKPSEKKEEEVPKKSRRSRRNDFAYC